jgi:hypothetical protein
MNEEVLELVLKYPQLLDNFDQQYRKELVVTYYRKNPTLAKSSYEKVAEVYNKAMAFKVGFVRQTVQEVLGLKASNASMQIGYAKRKGLIPHSIKTNHSRGYRQKNYVAK